MQTSPETALARGRRNAEQLAAARAALLLLAAHAHRYPTPPADLDDPVARVDVEVEDGIAVEVAVGILVPELTGTGR